MKSENPFIEYIGPTWEKAVDSPFYKTPAKTLGWHCINWILEHTQNEEGTGPFILTPEQARFILHWYELNDDGSFRYDEGCFQRLKGHGKDPMICCLSLFESLGDARFAGWNDDGTPKAKPVHLPLVQIAATTQNQTDTTLRLYKSYLTPEAVRKYGIEINTETVKSFGQIVIDAVTNNPSALEGKVSTAVFRNETHLWLGRLGHEMALVIARNVAKVKGGTARVLSITNAYDPNQGSVAQSTRETYEAQMAKWGWSVILYDSVEALPNAPVDTREQIAELVEAVRGDSDWSNVERIVNEFFDTSRPTPTNRRFWLNTITSSEDDWIDLRDFDKCVVNTSLTDKSIKKGDEIVMFGDFSKSDDSSVLIGCRISDSYIFKIAAWHKPTKGSGPLGTKWLVPRNEKDRRKYDFDPALGYPNPYANVETAEEAVERAFRTWKVKAFFADPSHAKDEVDHRSYWGESLEKWHIKHSKELVVWSGSKSGTKAEAIEWDMSDPKRIEEFAEFAERAADLIMRHELLIENDPDFRSHVKNAKIYETREKRQSIWKGLRGGNGKIDMAVGMIGALMLRSKYLKQVGETKKKFSTAYARFN